MPAMDDSCPTSFFLISAGAMNLARQRRLLPNKLISHFGRGDESFRTRTALAAPAHPCNPAKIPVVFFFRLRIS